MKFVVKFLFSFFRIRFFVTEIKLSFVMRSFRVLLIFCALFQSVLGVSLAAPHYCLWIQRNCGIFFKTGSIWFVSRLPHLCQCIGFSLCDSLTPSLPNCLVSLSLMSSTCVNYFCTRFLFPVHSTSAFTVTRVQDSRNM